MIPKQEDTKIDWNAVAARLEVIADALDLPYSECESAAHGGENGILSFAARHGQSLDWIVFGDVRPMLSRGRGGHCSRTVPEK